jgi:hypothetical protein
MDETPSRLRPMMRLAERRMRKSGHLKSGDRILEWKQGRIRRWRIDGSDQATPKFYGLERIPIFNGMMAINYSSCCIFLIGAGGRIWMTDLAFIIRIWHAAPRSVCLIYSTFNPGSDGNTVAVRLDADEPLDELAAFADRIRVRGRGRLAGFPAEWQERAKSRVAEITASGRLESDLALLDENQAAARRPQPRTVLGRWLRASTLRMTAESDHYFRQLYTAGLGWHEDEVSVVAAASELAARRYFGPQASPDRVAAIAAQIYSRSSFASDKSSVEAVIRHLSGDRTAAVLSDIPAHVISNVKLMFIFFVITNLDIEFELDKLICDAEALAVKRGFNPTLAL